MGGVPAHGAQEGLGDERFGAFGQLPHGAGLRSQLGHFLGVLAQGVVDLHLLLFISLDLDLVLLQRAGFTVDRLLRQGGLQLRETFAGGLNVLLIAGDLTVVIVSG